MLRLDLHNYSHAYIFVKWRISVTGINAANRTTKNLTFKDNAPFRPSISKIKNTFIDNAEDLDIVMPINNLQEYSNLDINICNSSSRHIFKNLILKFIRPEVL